MNPSLTVLRRAALLAVACIIVLIGMTLTLATATTSCESLTGLMLSHAKITSAANVAAGAFRPPVAGPAGNNNAYAALPSFCRVTATLTPSSDSDIKIELWLPRSGWNGKFEAVGNGGWAGSIPFGSIAAALAAGFAGAGTDTGHTGNNADFALGHPEKMTDFGYRSTHEMTVQSKLIINSYYGVPAKLSYFNGCSQGGRQGLAEAQRYPQDFNGIIAGASAINQMRMHAARTALNMNVNKDADSVIPKTKYEMIHNAVLQACDGLDGVKDGVIENPASCKFDYAKLLCHGADGTDCLTKGQVESAKAMTSTLKDPKTGKTLFDGHLMIGSELGWATIGGPQPLNLSVSGMQNVVFQDKKWDYHTMNFSTDLDRASASDGGATATTDPNLKPFFDHGGKLLMYHGWSDPQVNPLNSVNYYADVVKTVGKKTASNSIALFMIPGMNHCSGGPGTDTFDKLQVMEDWVAKGKTPTRIVASHLTSGKADKTRPLCPYGQIARYTGSGDTNDAANFTCKAGS
jgi:feruloyl esterase